MTFKRFQRKRKTGNPIISIGENRFNYLSSMVAEAELTDDHRVSYFVDETKFRIGFEFSKNETDYNYPMRSKSVGNGIILRSNAGEIISEYDWVHRVENLLPPKMRKFEVERIEGLLVIELPETFNNEMKGMVSIIPKDLGSQIDSRPVMYRCIKNGDIVRYGIKKIYTDLNEYFGAMTPPFEKVQYHFIEGVEPEQELDYWMELYKSRNKNKEPKHQKRLPKS